MKRIISYLLILAGILLILVPLVGTYINQNKQNQLYLDYLESQDKVGVILPGAPPINNSNNSGDSDITEEETEEVVKDETAKRPEVLGRIIIKEIKMDLLLVEGASAAELRWGAGHLKGTAFPGELGNCAISGHRNYTFGSHFNRLDEVVVGNIITINYKNKNYDYLVDKVFIVEPDDVSVLEAVEGESILTLITCTPKNSASHRLIIQGHLMDI